MNDHISNKQEIDVYSEINEVFVKTIYTIPVIHNEDNLIALPISEKKYIKSIQFLFDGNYFSIQNNENILTDIKLPSVNLYHDWHNPSLLFINIQDIPSVKRLFLIITTYELLEEKLGAFTFAIQSIYNHEISIRSQYGIDLLSNSNAYEMERISDEHLIIKTRTDHSNNESKYISVRYKMKEKPLSIIYKSKIEDANYFLLDHTFQRPDLPVQKLNEIFFVVDLSYKISPKQIDIQKDLIKKVLKNTRSTDKINMLCYSGSYYIFSNYSVFCSDINIDKLIDFFYKFSPDGQSDIETLFKYCSIVPIPLGYCRNFILLTGNNKYPLNQIDKISNYILSSRCFILLIDNTLNIGFSSAIMQKHIGEYFNINDTIDIDLFIKNIYPMIESELISEIDFDFGDSELLNIIDTQSAAIHSSKPLYVAGVTDKPITNAPIVRTIISSAVDDTKCDNIIEINNDILSTYISTNGFRLPNPNVYISSTNDENNSKEQQLIFDDTEEDTSDLEVYQTESDEGFNYSVYSNSEIDIQHLVKAISKSKNQLEDTFLDSNNLLTSNKLLLSFHLTNNLIECNAIYFSQIEYDVHIKDNIRRYVTNALNNIIKRNSVEISSDCRIVLEYK